MKITENFKPFLYQNNQLPLGELSSDAFEDFIYQSLSLLGEQKNFKMQSGRQPSGDEGFDCTAKNTTDKELVCIQCKRYNSTLYTGTVVEEIVKKELIKPVEKIEKVVKHDTPKLIPTSTIKTQHIVPKKAIVSTETKNIIKNEYLSKLRAEIEKNKIYPKRAKRLKQQGKVVVTFLLSKNGQIKNINLKNGSSFKGLNKAALELLERIGKFEPIPKELEKNNWTIEIPINYAIINT